MSEEDSEKKVKKVSTLQRLRASHNFRLGLILVLMAITAILFYFWEKGRIVLIVAFVALLAAFGLEVGKTDYDLGKLWESKSLQESKVSRDESGNILFDKLGNVTTNSSKGKKVDEYNCDDFQTNPEAQSFYMKVGGLKRDVNRLDGNKNGQACESLPQGSGN